MIESQQFGKNLLISQAVNKKKKPKQQTVINTNDQWDQIIDLEQINQDSSSESDSEDDNQIDQIRDLNKLDFPEEEWEKIKAWEKLKRKLKKMQKNNEQLSDQEQEQIFKILEKLEIPDYFNPKKKNPKAQKPMVQSEDDVEAIFQHLEKVNLEAEQKKKKKFNLEQSILQTQKEDPTLFQRLQMVAIEVPQNIIKKKKNQPQQQSQNEEIQQQQLQKMILESQIKSKKKNQTQLIGAEPEIQNQQQMNQLQPWTIDAKQKNQQKKPEQSQNIIVDDDFQYQGLQQFAFGEEPNKPKKKDQPKDDEIIDDDDHNLVQKLNPYSSQIKVNKTDKQQPQPIDPYNDEQRDQKVRALQNLEFQITKKKEKQKAADPQKKIDDNDDKKIQVLQVMQDDIINKNIKNKKQQQQDPEKIENNIQLLRVLEDDLQQQKKRKNQNKEDQKQEEEEVQQQIQTLHKVQLDIKQKQNKKQLPVIGSEDDDVNNKLTVLRQIQDELIQKKVKIQAKKQQNNTDEDQQIKILQELINDQEDIKKKVINKKKSDQQEPEEKKNPLQAFEIVNSKPPQQKKKGDNNNQKEQDQLNPLAKLNEEDIKKRKEKKIQLEKKQQDIDQKITVLTKIIFDQNLDPNKIIKPQGDKKDDLNILNVLKDLKLEYEIKKKINKREIDYNVPDEEDDDSNQLKPGGEENHPHKIQKQEEKQPYEDNDDYIKIEELDQASKIKKYIKQDKVPEKNNKDIFNPEKLSKLNEDSPNYKNKKKPNQDIDDQQEKINILNKMDNGYDDQIRNPDSKSLISNEDDDNQPKKSLINPNDQIKIPNSNKQHNDPAQNNNNPNSLKLKIIDENDPDQNPNKKNPMKQNQLQPIQVLKPEQEQSKRRARGNKNNDNMEDLNNNDINGKNSNKPGELDEEYTDDENNKNNNQNGNQNKKVKTIKRNQSEMPDSNENGNQSNSPQKFSDTNNREQRHNKDISEGQGEDIPSGKRKQQIAYDEQVAQGDIKKQRQLKKSTKDFQDQNRDGDQLNGAQNFSNFNDRNQLQNKNLDDNNCNSLSKTDRNNMPDNDQQQSKRDQKKGIDFQAENHNENDKFKLNDSQQPAIEDPIILDYADPENKQIKPLDIITKKKQNQSCLQKIQINYFILAIILLIIMMIVGVILGTLFRKTGKVSTNSRDIIVFKDYDLIKRILKNQEQNVVRRMLYPGQIYLYNYTLISTSLGQSNSTQQESTIVHQIAFICSEVHESFFEMYLYVKNTYIFQPGLPMQHQPGYPDILINKSNNSSNQTNQRFRVLTSSTFDQEVTSEEIDEKIQQDIADMNITFAQYKLSSLPILKFFLRKNGEIANLTSPIYLRGNIWVGVKKLLEQFGPALSLDLFSKITYSDGQNQEQEVTPGSGRILASNTSSKNEFIQRKRTANLNQQKGKNQIFMQTFKLSNEEQINQQVNQDDYHIFSGDGILEKSSSNSTMKILSNVNQTNTSQSSQDQQLMEDLNINITTGLIYLQSSSLLVDDLADIITLFNTMSKVDFTIADLDNAEKQRIIMLRNSTQYQQNRRFLNLKNKQQHTILQSQPEEQQNSTQKHSPNLRLNVSDTILFQYNLIQSQITGLFSAKCERLVIKNDQCNISFDVQIGEQLYNIKQLVIDAPLWVLGQTYNNFRRPILKEMNLLIQEYRKQESEFRNNFTTLLNTAKELFNLTLSNISNGTGRIGQQQDNQTQNRFYQQLIQRSQEFGNKIAEIFQNSSQFLQIDLQNTQQAITKELQHLQAVVNRFFQSKMKKMNSSWLIIQAFYDQQIPQITNLLNSNSNRYGQSSKELALEFVDSFNLLYNMYVETFISKLQNEEYQRISAFVEQTVTQIKQQIKQVSKNIEFLSSDGGVQFAQFKDILLAALLAQPSLQIMEQWKEKIQNNSPLIDNIKTQATALKSKLADLTKKINTMAVVSSNAITSSGIASLNSQIQLILDKNPFFISQELPFMVEEISTVDEYQQSLLDSAQQVLPGAANNISNSLKHLYNTLKQNYDEQKEQSILLMSNISQQVQQQLNKLLTESFQSYIKNFTQLFDSWLTNIKNIANKNIEDFIPPMEKEGDPAPEPEEATQDLDTLIEFVQNLTLLQDDTVFFMNKQLVNTDLLSIVNKFKESVVVNHAQLVSKLQNMDFSFGTLREMSSFDKDDIHFLTKILREQTLSAVNNSIQTNNGKIYNAVDQFKQAISSSLELNCYCDTREYNKYINCRSCQSVHIQQGLYQLTDIQHIYIQKLASILQYFKDVGQPTQKNFQTMQLDTDKQQKFLMSTPNGDPIIYSFLISIKGNLALQISDFNKKQISIQANFQQLISIQAQTSLSQITMESGAYANGTLYSGSQVLYIYTQVKEKLEGKISINHTANYNKIQTGYFQIGIQRIIVYDCQTTQNSTNNDNSTRILQSSKQNNTSKNDILSNIFGVLDTAKAIKKPIKKGEDPYQKQKCWPTEKIQFTPKIDTVIPTMIEKQPRNQILYEQQF